MALSLRAVIPTDRELQIDIDSDRALRHFRKRYGFFCSQLRAYHRLGWRIRMRVVRSKGAKGHYHATVTMSQRMTLLERLCAQVLLGDDENRAMYNFFRYLNESRFPILFYEKNERSKP